MCRSEGLQESDLFFYVGPETPTQIIRRDWGTFTYGASCQPYEEVLIWVEISVIDFFLGGINDLEKEIKLIGKGWGVQGSSEMCAYLVSTWETLGLSLSTENTENNTNK